MSTIKDFFRFQNGYAFKSSDFTSDGQYRIVKIKEIKDGRIKFFEDSAQITPSNDFDTEKYIVRKGDVLFALTGDPVSKPNPLSWVGRVAYYDYDEPALINQRVCKAIKTADIPLEYLYYFFRQNSEFYTLAGKATGSASQANISTKTIEEHPINVPNKESIDRTIDLLKSLDDKISVNSRLNKNLEEQAIALLSNEIANSGDSILDVSEIAFLNPSRDLKKGTTAKCIDMAKLSTSGSFPSGWDIKPFNGGMKFKNGDTIMARITPCLENGKTAYINFLDEDEVAFGSTEYIVLSPKEGIPSELLYCLARYPSFVDYSVKHMNGSSGRQRVAADSIGKYKLPVFSNEFLSMFSTTVGPMFETICNNSMENMRLSSLRDLLLPKLMSGEIDVSNIDI